MAKAKKARSIAIEKLSADIQTAIAQAFPDRVEKTAEGWALKSGATLGFKELGDDIRQQISADSARRKKASEPAVLARPRIKASRIDRFIAEEWAYHGRYPDQDEIALIEAQASGTLKAAGFVATDVQYKVPAKEAREAVRDAFCRPVIGVFYANRDTRMEGVREGFLKRLGNNYSHALSNAGLEPEAIAAMAADGICPNGYSVHHNLPIEGGGANETSNFVLIQDSVYHKLLHRLIDKELGGTRPDTGDSRLIALPSPPGGCLFYRNPEAMVSAAETNDVVPAPPESGEKAPLVTADLTTDQLKTLANGLPRVRSTISLGNYGKLTDVDDAMEAVAVELVCRGQPLPKSYQGWTPTRHVERADGSRVAYRAVEGTGPTLVYIHGSHGSMEGRKGDFLQALAEKEGRAFVRLDLTGHGKSSGDFADGSPEQWCRDVIDVVNQATTGPVVLVGASLGGGVALDAAKALPDRVVGVIGLAPAVDDPTTLTSGPQPLSCPVAILAGSDDDVVPVGRTQALADELATTTTVGHIVIPEGRHGFGKRHELAAVQTAVKGMVEDVAGSTARPKAQAGLKTDGIKRPAAMV